MGFEETGIHLIKHQAKNIGNILSNYFDLVCISFERKIDFKADLQLDTGLFIDNLPDFIKYDEKYSLVPQNRETYSSWMWEYEPFQNAHLLQNLFQNIFKEIIPIDLWNQAYIEEPIVIHFRASDSPMNRHDNYTMVHYSWYNKILNLIGNNSYPDICILFNNSWGKQDADVTNYLIEHFVKFLQNRGHKVRIISGSVELDFIRMIRAKYLINGCIMSSMSYMAGFISDNISILQSTIFSNCNFSKRVNFNIINSLNYRIPHKLIPDYYDYENINNLLQVTNTKNNIAFKFDNEFQYMALENAYLAQNLFPEWNCNFYVTKNNFQLSDAFIQLSKMKNVELIIIDENQDWKKYALNQNNYNAVIIRNIESLLDENDVTNVNEWLNGLCDFNVKLSHLYNIEFNNDNYYDNFMRNNKVQELFIFNKIFDNICETDYLYIGVRNKLLNNTLKENFEINDFDYLFSNIIIPFLINKRTIYIS